MKHRDSKRTTTGKRRTLTINAARSAKSETTIFALKGQWINRLQGGSR